MIFQCVNPWEQWALWSALTPSTKGRKIQWPQPHRAEYCQARGVELVLHATTCAQSNRSFCPHSTVLGFKENLGCTGWQHHPSFSSENLHKCFQTSLWTIVRTLLLRASEMPSVCTGRAVLRAAWVLMMRQMSHKGTGDEFSFLVHAQVLKAECPSLLSFLQG